jgi:hypothetical protein
MATMSFLLSTRSATVRRVRFGKRGERMKMQASSERVLSLVPSHGANHVDVVESESVLIPTDGGSARKYPHQLKELKLLEAKDDYLPTFLKWASPSARLSEERTIFDRVRL